VRRRALLAGALALLLAACGGGSDAGKGITIGVQKSGVLFVAKERGEVEKQLAGQGIAPVKWVEFPSGPPLIEAMRAGAVDLGAVGDTPVAYAQASGSDILYVATHSFPSSITGGLIVPKGSTIRTAADLKGKRLAFTKGSASELSAVVALKKHGLTLKDVTPVYLAPGDAMTAFANGSIDAWLTWDPYRALAEERFGAREVAIDRAGLAATVFYIARGPVVRNRPQVITATLDALREEAAWARANLDAVTALSSDATRLPPAVQRKMIDRYGGNAFAVNPVTSADIANQQRVLDYLTEAKVIDRKLDAKAVAWTGWTPGD
jgi:sulfonate transport system substrate-binding protein